MLFQDYMFFAIEQSKLAMSNGCLPIGSIIVYKNELISCAYNEEKTESVKLPKSLLHAEIIAMSKACDVLKMDRLDGCDLYTTLEPCLMCFSAISIMRVKRIIFGAYNIDRGAISTSTINCFEYVPEIIGGVSEIECSEILKSFFVKKRL